MFKLLTFSKRLKEQIYARTHGYFWAPCPICGEYFGGHEKGGDVGIIYEQGIGWAVEMAVCPKLECKQEAERQNAIGPEN